MRRLLCFFLIISLFVSFFGFNSYAVSGSYTCPYLENVTYNTSTKKLVSLSSSSTFTRVYYISMSDVLNHSFEFSVTSVNYGVNVTNYFYCNSLPSVGVDAYNNSMISPSIKVNTFNSAYDITDIMHSFYNTEYSYLCILVVADSYSVSALNVLDLSASPLSINSPSPGLTPSPVVTPVPDVTPAPDLNVFAGSDTFVFGGENYPVWPSASYRFAPSDYEHVYDSRSDGTGIVSTHCVYPVRIPFWIETNLSGSYVFDLNFNIESYELDVDYPDSSFNVKPIIDKSSPYIYTEDSTIAWSASFLEGNSVSFNVYNVPVNNKISPSFYLCFDVSVSYNANFEYSNFFNSCLVTCNNLSFSVTRQVVLSQNSSGILGEINSNIIKGNEQDKQFHDDEMAKADQAIDEMTSGVDQLTGVLSKWEIITMPVQITSDLVDAISSEGSTGLTFPSVTIMGQQLWPSYTFDLNVIAEKLPLLHKSLHVISSILLVSWFIHYLWRKWHILTGDDTPEGS